MRHADHSSDGGTGGGARRRHSTRDETRIIGLWENVSFVFWNSLPVDADSTRSLTVLLVFLIRRPDLGRAALRIDTVRPSVRLSVVARFWRPISQKLSPLELHLVLNWRPVGNRPRGIQFRRQIPSWGRSIGGPTPGPAIIAFRDWSVAQSKRRWRY